MSRYDRTARKSRNRKNPELRKYRKFEIRWNRWASPRSSLPPPIVLGSILVVNSTKGRREVYEAVGTTTPKPRWVSPEVPARCGLNELWFARQSVQSALFDVTEPDPATPSESSESCLRRSETRRLHRVSSEPQRFEAELSRTFGRVAAQTFGDVVPPPSSTPYRYRQVHRIQ